MAAILDRVARAEHLATELGVRLIGAGTAVPDLERSVGLLEAMSSPIWAAMPHWAAAQGPGRETVLSSAAVAAQVEEALAWVAARFGADLPVALANLRPVGADGRVVQQLQAAWQSHEAKENLAARLKPLTPHAILFEAEEPALVRVVTRVDELRTTLHADALAQLWELVPRLGLAAWFSTSDPVRFRGLPELVIRALDSWPAVESLLEHYGRLAQPPPVNEAREQQVERAAKPISQPPTAPLQAAFQGFDHPMTNEHGKLRSSLVVVTIPGAGEETGSLRIAIRVKATSPLSTGQAVLYVRASHLRSMRPGRLTETTELVDDPTTKGVRCLRAEITMNHWDAARGGSHFLDLVVAVPAYRAFLQKVMKDRDELRISLEVHVEQERHTGTLSFNRFQEGMPSLSVPQEDQTDIEAMKAAPLGVQLGYPSLEPYVRGATKSFFVSAPRRFGKTTLLRHLSAVAAENADSAVVKVTLNRNDSPSRSMATVLRHLRTELQDQHRIEVDFPLSDGGLPDRRTFREARKQLKKRGFKHLVLFVDEAQSLVPRSDGGTWGNNLKDLIESDLAESTPELAKVCIVMAGTPQLPRRLGANCQAFMNVMAERTFFDEAELAAFLRRLSSDLLDSTAQARERLAGTANNLYTLKQILGEVLSILRTEGRAFFVSHDVDTATANLLANDQKGSVGLWDYVAAELSHTDEWDPIDAYPVALALAACGSAEGGDRTGLVLPWLDERLAENKIQASVAEERVQDGVRELMRLGILAEDATFKRPLLEQLLRRRGRANPFQHNLDQIALARLAADIIPWDERALPRSKGGQAHVYLLPVERPQAWRVCALESPIERRRFVRTCAAIKVLRDIRTRLDGDRYLPRVRQAGFDIDDPNRGIIVYDWIDGTPFEEYWSTSSVGARAHVVRQVAGALDALQARGVVHRDVHPRNVLVDVNMNAVLIDFGMACLSDESTHSNVAEHGFLAPELLDGTPATIKSDVFSLGQILKGPAGNGDPLPNDLLGLMRSMTHRSPADRPDPGAVAARLKDLLAAAPFVAQLDSAKAKRDAALEVALSFSEWLYDALQPLSETAAFRLAGLQPWSTDAAIQVASCLNGVFEAWVKRRECPAAVALDGMVWPGRSPSLAAIRNVVRDDKGLQGWIRDEIVSAGALRNAGAHPSDRADNLDRARQHERNRKPLDVYASTLKATAQRLDGAIGSGVAIAQFVALAIVGDQST